MSLNPEYISGAKPAEPTLSAVGIGAVSGAQMIRTLARLGLIQSSAEVEKLAASGLALNQMIVKKLSIYEVDQALAKTDANFQARMAFKAALSQQGLMEHKH